MKIVVDTNIVFSAVLNMNSRIADLLMNSDGVFSFYSTNQLLAELEEHQPKLLRLTGRTPVQLREIIWLVTEKIRFIQSVIVPEIHNLTAIELTKNIDVDDAGFVAMTEFLHAKLWTGDKKLMNGLRAKGWANTLSTEEIFLLRLDIEQSK